MSLTPYVGIDLVHIPAFGEQLELPGTTFLKNFTAFEVLDSKENQSIHLAGKWAAKEAFIKAWSAAITPEPPLIPRDEVNFGEIEVRKDIYGRPFLELHGLVSSLYALEPPQISISHDGDYSTAICSISRAK